MTPDNHITTRLEQAPYTWTVTGAGGFIGAHLTDYLLRHNQKVIALDNLSACGTRNLDRITTTNTEAHKNLTVINGDIRDYETCLSACKNSDFVLHQAAIGSVPRSLEDPIAVDAVNVGGFLSVLKAAAQHNVKRFIYASSSAVYGNVTTDKNQEDQPLSPQSPYAVGKYTNELYAAALGPYYGIDTIGLRYFNIYGPWQDPNGAYAAVIPKWIEAMKNGQTVEIFGDGETVRDFCYVEDVARANILAATTTNEGAVNTVYNVASGQDTTLNDLAAILRDHFALDQAPLYKPERPADVKISRADTEKAARHLDFRATTAFKTGIKQTIHAYRES